MMFFNWLTSIKMDLYLVGIWSLMINAFIKAFCTTVHTFIMKEIDFDENLKLVIYLVLALISAVICSIFYKSDLLRSFLGKFFNKTLGNDVFKDIIDFKQRTVATVFLKESEIYYIGVFKHMDEKDADSYIALIEYSAVNKSNNEIIRNFSDEKASIVFCLNEIEHIEFIYEDESEVWKRLTRDNETIESDADENVV